MRKFVLLFTVSICILTAGCKKAPPTWSAESKSPDGKLIATAKTYEQSGFGTGWVQTTVYLNWATNKNPPAMILAFSDGPAGPDGMKVGMNWLSPTHLELTYRGQRDLDFQAVKFSSVSITVRDLSASTGSSTQ